MSIWTLSFIDEIVKTVAEVMHVFGIREYTVALVGSILEKKDLTRVNDVDFVIVADTDIYWLNKLGYKLLSRVKRVTKGVFKVRACLGGYYGAHKVDRPTITLLLYNYRLYSGACLDYIPGLPSFIAYSWSKRSRTLYGQPLNEIRDVNAIKPYSLLAEPLGLTDLIVSLTNKVRFVVTPSKETPLKGFVKLEGYALRSYMRYALRWAVRNARRAGIEVEPKLKQRLRTYCCTRDVVKLLHQILDIILNSYCRGCVNKLSTLLPFYWSCYKGPTLSTTTLLH